MVGDPESSPRDWIAVDCFGRQNPAVESSEDKVH